MTKKDFQLIAEVFKYKGVTLSKFVSCYAVAEALAQSNPRFNKDKFLKACGVEVPNVKR